MDVGYKLNPTATNERKELQNIASAFYSLCLTKMVVNFCWLNELHEMKAELLLLWKMTNIVENKKCLSLAIPLHIFHFFSSCIYERKPMCDCSLWSVTTGDYANTTSSLFGSTRLLEIRSWTFQSSSPRGNPHHLHLEWSAFNFVKWAREVYFLREQVHLISTFQAGP